jgi:hypothetical protein
MPGPHVHGLFQIRTWSNVHNNDQTVLIFLVKDEHAGLHICAKRICDRPRRLVIIEQRLAVAMVNKTVEITYSWLDNSLLFQV